MKSSTVDTANNAALFSSLKEGMSVFVWLSWQSIPRDTFQLLYLFAYRNV